MPADGLEAQDVVPPPRCGFWAGRAAAPSIPSISRRRRPPAAALHDWLLGVFPSWLRRARQLFPVPL